MSQNHLIWSGPVGSSLTTVTMFWKQTAWSWDQAVGNEDDDGGYLLAAELKKTPDSTSDPDLKPISTTTASITSLSNRTRTTTAGLKDLTNQNLEPNNSNYSSNPANANHSSFVPTLCTGTNPSQGTRTSTQRLTVSPDSNVQCFLMI